MSKSKSTKRALITSLLAVAVCVVMLIGTTFAWFTDTASTSVNKIQAGTLGIALEMKNAKGEWVTAEGQQLQFKKAADGEDQEIIWEPGCTYDLPELRVVNNGSLALKYKVVITGIAGDAKLNNAIEWTMDGVEVGAEVSLAAKDSKEFTISGHMKEDAGNEYQGLSIDGIAITVYATQDTVEYDSYDNQYDKNADGTPQFNTWNDNVTVSATVETSKDTVIEDKDENPTIKAVVPQGSTTASELTLIKNITETPANITVETGTDAVTAEVKLIDENGNKVTANGDTFFTVSMDIGKDLNVIGFYHNETPLTKAADAESLTADDMYFYDAYTGYIIFTTDDFSPFTAVVSDSVFNGGDGTEEHPYLIANGDQAYKMRNFNQKNKSLYFKLIDNVVTTGEIYLNKSTATIDLNGYSIKLEYGSDVKPNNGGVFNLASTSNLTINDSSAAQTGAVIGSGDTYDGVVTCAVKVGSYAKLTINGGHFKGTSEATSCIFVKTTTATKNKSTVTINGGKFETASDLNGIYYVLNHQDNCSAGCTITVNGGSFKNYNPSETAVDPANDKTGKIALGEGCTVTSDGDWFVVSK